MPMALAGTALSYAARGVRLQLSVQLTYRIRICSVMLMVIRHTESAAQ